MTDPDDFWADRGPSGGDDPRGLVAHAQLAAGILAARHRGDRRSAAMLAAEVSADDLLAGALLLADLLAGMYAQSCDEDPAECLSGLSILIEASAPGST